MLNSGCGAVKRVFDWGSLQRYRHCDFLYFEATSVSEITEGMKTNFDSRLTGKVCACACACACLRVCVCVT